MTETLVNIGMTAAFSLMVMIFMLIARWITSGAAVGKNNNTALALRQSGAYIAVAIACTAALGGGESKGFAADLLQFVKDGAIVLVAIFIASKINDWFIVPGVDNNEAVLLRGNTAVGFTEFGSYVATGLIASSSFGGSEGGWLTAAVFFGLGQLALIVVFWVQEVLLPGSFVREVGNGQNGAGITVAGVLIALGVILQASIAGPFLGWAESLKWFAIYTAGGIVLLVVFQEVFNTVLVSRTRIEERYANVASSGVVACGQIGLAVVISSLF